MKVGHLDCFAGAAGDMLVGAALAAGVDPDGLGARLASLGVPGLEWDAYEVRRAGLRATRFEVRTAPENPHRGLSEVLDIVRRGDWSPRVLERIQDCFSELARAEADVHGIDVESVHFHEVGAVDAIADICAAIWCFDELGLGHLSCTEVVTGFGTVHCEHGELPVPAPATARLLEGIPCRSGELAGEACTPTGAALLRNLVDAWEPARAHRAGRVGHGAGSRDPEGRPNVVRLRVGEDLGEPGAERVVELRMQVDNCSGEVLGLAFDKVLAAGALDVLLLPALTKKNRPAQLVVVLTEESVRPRVEDVLLRELPSLGLRRVACERRTLERGTETVQTEFGAVCFKLRRLPGGELLRSPESDEVARISEETGLPVPVVLDRLQRGRE